MSYIYNLQRFLSKKIDGRIFAGIYGKFMAESQKNPQECWKHYLEDT